MVKLKIARVAAAAAASAGLIASFSDVSFVIVCLPVPLSGCRYDEVVVSLLFVALSDLLARSDP